MSVKNHVTLQLFNVSQNSTFVNKLSYYNETAFLEIPRCDKTVTITCNATNRVKSVLVQHKLVVYEIFNGFGISTSSGNKTLWFLENDIVTIKCLGSRDEFSNVTWSINDEESSGTGKKITCKTSL